MKKYSSMNELHTIGKQKISHNKLVTSLIFVGSARLIGLAIAGLVARDIDTDSIVKAFKLGLVQLDLQAS